MPRPSATYRRIAGTEQLSAALLAYPAAMRAEILREGVGEACQPILTAAKRFAKRSEATGALRESLTIKTKAYPASGKAVGLVGPDRAYYRRGKKQGKLGALLGGGALRRPANYAHLVEYGHRIAVGGTLKRIDGRGRPGTGRSGGFVPPRPFIRPAVLTTTSQQAEGFLRGIARGLERVSRRVKKAA